MSYEGLINELFNRVIRYIKAQPLNLGGFTTTSGGGGGPPGGFTGYLPQSRMAFDETEAEIWPIPSGPTLVDNLNRIRYRLADLEASGVGSSGTSWDLVVQDDSVVVLSGVTVLDFVGELVATQTGSNKITVSGVPTVLSDHDHSGDAGDGGTFDAANLTSATATSGYVLSADGISGASWTLPVVDWDNITNKPILSEILFLHEDDADIAGYEKLLTTPASGVEVVDTATMLIADTEYPIDEYITYPIAGMGATLLGGGSWEFNTYAKVSNIAGVTKIVIRVYKRNQAGTETELFNVETDEINNTTVALVTKTSIQPDYALDLEDRLVVKYLAKSTVGASQVVSLYYEGTTNYSHIHIPGSSSSSTGSGHTIQDEGVDLTQRTNLNFVGGGVTVTDDSVNDATVVTIAISGIDEHTHTTLENLTITNDLNVEGMGYYDNGITVNASGLGIYATSVFPALTELVGNLHGSLSAEEPPHSHKVYLDAEAGEGNLSLYNRVARTDLFPNSVKAYTLLTFNNTTGKSTWEVYLTETPDVNAITTASGYTQFGNTLRIGDGLIVGSPISEIATVIPPAGTVVLKELLSTPATPSTGYGLFYVSDGTPRFIDDAGNDSSLLTVGSGGGHTIQDEGINLTQRTNLNFVGSAVTVTDDSINDATIVTITISGITTSGTGEILTDDSILINSISFYDDLTDQVPTTSFITLSGFVPGTLKIYYNGIRQRRINYTEGVSSFTTGFVTSSGDSMIAEYDLAGYAISTILYGDDGDVLYEY